MPRPRKYTGLHDRQAAYHQTQKGKAAVKKYQSSEEAKAKKRLWWKENRGTEAVDRQQQFLDTYGSLAETLALLNRRERQAVSLYFGLDNSQPCTLEEIGIQMGISKQRVGQLKSNALKKTSVVKLAGGNETPIQLDKHQDHAENDAADLA